MAGHDLATVATKREGKAILAATVEGHLVTAFLNADPRILRRDLMIWSASNHLCQIILFCASLQNQGIWIAFGTCYLIGSRRWTLKKPSLRQNRIPKIPRCHWHLFLRFERLRDGKHLGCVIIHVTLWMFLSRISYETFLRWQCI